MLSNKLKQYLNVFWHMLKIDLLVYAKGLKGQVIDTSIWTAGTVLVAAYILPMLGIKPIFGALMASASIANSAIFSIWSAAAVQVSDICGDKKINYYFTLPCPSWIIFVQQACSFAVKSITIAFFMAPLCKVLMWNTLSLENFSIIKFVLMIIALNLCAGFLVVFMVSIAKTMSSMESVWTRVLYPLWLLGGSQFSWQTLMLFSPGLAYAALFNPLLYMTEGIRGAILGAEGFISFWVCLVALCFFGTIFAGVGILKLQKRLDFI
jgi:ABC-type polysaccharide/polyol phosphate export permease